MSLCKLVVLDFQQWINKKPLESFNTGYFEEDVQLWKLLVKEDLAMGITQNSWWGFNNKNFLCFLNILLSKMKKGTVAKMLVDIEIWCKRYPSLLPPYDEILLHWNNVGFIYKRILYAELKIKVTEFVLKTSLKE